MKQSTRKLVVGAVIVALGLSSFAISRTYAKADTSAIADVMGKIFKGDKKKKIDAIVVKAQNGKATAEEIKTLQEQLKLLAAEKPPKGEQAAWDKRTAALIAAADSVAKGDAAGAKALKEAANCKTCHEAHQKKD